MGSLGRLVPADQAPFDIDQLFPREREIALFVYAHGCVTAKDVEAAVGSLTNAAVRSMLNRLVRKGLITRQELKAPNPFVYGPALTEVSAQERAIRQCADDFFDGSVDAVAAALADVYASRSSRPKAATTLKPPVPFPRKANQARPLGDPAFPLAAGF
ncbi:BlaI/MecI/CopY family transcriptional regulator [Sphingomonas lutea]|uniref:BlaI/MecI/CopY family transcriptional regulator n=1 Tax=Sphingomonas lutea TaxID=1045317 RepID=A0A7G9SH44_9SPHN|nr:BlaI/MecI/CopY family transcriptional regulator [Sphingomonas lutea]QNN67169.1 BlaI/MecI/CopY family transcriptional regulator [Sphingomonas lutea]